MFGKSRPAPLLLLAVAATITDLLVVATAEPTNQTRTISIPEKPSLPYWRRSSNVSTSAPNNTSTTTNRTNFSTSVVNSTFSTWYNGTNSSHVHPFSNSSIIQLNGTSSLNISRTNSSNSSSPSLTYQGRFNSSLTNATGLGNQSNSSSFFVNHTEPADDIMILPAVVEPTPASTYIVWIVVALSVLVIILLLIIVIILCRRRQTLLEERVKGQSPKVPVIIADDASTQAVRSTAKHFAVVDACSSSGASSTIIFEVDILDEDPKDPMNTAVIA